MSAAAPDRHPLGPATPALPGGARGQAPGRARAADPAGAGDVTSVSVIKSSKDTAYDERLVTAARGWRYQPYRIAGQPVAVCSVVTFQYTIK